MALIRRPLSLLTLLVSVIVAVTGLPGVAAAEPGEDAGAPASLREVLDTSLRDFNDAKGRHDQAVARQAELAESMRVTQVRLALLTEQVKGVAVAAYRGNRVSSAVVILDSDSPTGMLHALTTVQFLTRRDDRQLRDLTTAKKLYETQQAEQATLVRTSKDQLDIMAKRKQEAEVALAKAGGGQLSSGFVPGKATAKQAPRSADGSWPKESCNTDDPTTDGCITARMLHSYNEARLAGFTRYTACKRSGGSGEHPKGRACDFSANTNGFVDANAGGADKTYGDRLAGWLIANASRLGVLYVIWYRQIWHPGSGWRSYSGGGSPAGAHTNHVHLSVQ